MEYLLTPLNFRPLLVAFYRFRLTLMNPQSADTNQLNRKLLSPGNEPQTIVDLSNYPHSFCLVQLNLKKSVEKQF